MVSEREITSKMGASDAIVIFFTDVIPIEESNLHEY